MAQVSLDINGRSYTVGCADGEEERLRGLAKYVDAKVRDLAATVGAVGEARLLVLACLTLADELGEAYQEAEQTRAAEADGRALQDRVNAIEAQLASREDVVVQQLDRLARRMAGMADRLDAN